MAVSLENKIKAVIAEQLGMEEEEIALESSIVDDLGADSIDIADLVMALEEEFELDVSDEEAEKMVRVKDIVEYIRQNVQ